MKLSYFFVSENKADLLCLLGEGNEDHAEWGSLPFFNFNTVGEEIKGIIGIFGIVEHLYFEICVLFEVIGDFYAEIELFVKITCDLYVFFWDSAEVVALEYEDEGGRGKFVVGHSRKGEGGRTVIQIDVRYVFNFDFVGFLALDDKLGFALYTVGFAAFYFGDVGELVFGGIGDLYGFGDYLSELTGEDDGLSFLKIGGKDCV